ncbi:MULTISPECIES: lipopolysaccharide biosynthesis protein [unclassified Candidatus Cardinium]|uniref:lipopolysaccharide biosynthesis protein n=1 Tax=unclassified Candidatus Cardinium TaxID=2641185 RepID=UPI001FB4F2A1|nr:MULTISPECIES: hypothetical protein [unclassified Candidatus Cardinium]
MQNKVKTLGKETIIYSISNIIVRGCSYLVLLIQTHRLTPSTYSIVTEFYGTYLALGHVFYDLAMDMTYFRFVHKLGKQYTFNIIVTLLLLTSLVFSTLLIIYTPQIAKITNHLAHIRYFYYMTGILILDTLLMIPYANLRVEKKTFYFLSVKFLQAFANIIFSAILLYFPLCLRLIECIVANCLNLKVTLNGLDAVFMANLLSNLTALAFLLPNFKGFYLVWHSHTLQLIRRYATTSFLTTLFFRINETLPLWLFLKLTPNNFYSTHTKEEIFGNFGASCKLTVCITLGIQAFKHAAEPFFFANSDRKEALRLYSQTMHLFIVVSCFCLLIFSLNLSWIAKMLIPKADYRHTVDTVPYLTFTHIVLGVYYNISTSFKLGNQPQYNVWISAFGSLVIGSMALVWIPSLGHWGCVYAAMSGAVVMTLIGYYMGQRCYPIPYRKEGFLLILLTSLVVGHIPLWPSKLAFLGVGWAYIWLHIAILAIFYRVVIGWKKSMNLKE